MADSPPDLSQVLQQLPPDQLPDSVANAPNPAPVLAGSPGSPEAAAAANRPPVPTPILQQLISGLARPQMVAPAPGQMARPVSRLDTVEHFLGNFVQALGQGMAAAHGPGAFGKGFGAAVGAPYQQSMQQFQAGQQAQANQSEIQQRAAQSQLTQAQAQNLSNVVQTPYGPMSQGLAAKVFPAAIQADGRMGAAGITAQSRMGVAQFQAMLGLGQVGRVETGADGSQIAYNKYGQPLGQLEGAIDPRFLPTQNTSQQWLQTSPGVWQLVDKTATSRKIPGAGGASTPSQNIPKPKGGGAAGGGAPAGRGRTIYGGQVGTAFDPQTNEYVQTTPQDAQANGYKQFQKLGAKEQEDNRQLNNRLADVAQKITRYEGMLNQPLSQDDKDMISGVLSRDDFQLGAHAFGAGVEIPIDRLNQYLDAHNVKNMSPQAKQTLLAYENAREAMTGYQRVLSGSGRSSDKNLELNLNTLPSPVMPNDYIKEGIRQFKENVNIAGQGLPRMPGITRAKDIFAAAEPVQVQIPGQSPGTIPRGKLQEFQKKYPAARVLQQ